MAQENNRFSTADTIMSMMSSYIKNKDINILDIVEWCAELETDVLGDVEEMHEYFKYKVIIENYKGELPCNLYRLLDVFSASNERPNYYNDGTHLVFNLNQTFDTDENGFEYIYINFYGIPIDYDTGYPLIKKGHELACQWYCIWKLYTEDFLNGKIDNSRWAYIENQKMIQAEAAKGGFRHKSHSDMKKILVTVHNMVPRINTMPLAHLNQSYKYNR